MAAFHDKYRKNQKEIPHADVSKAIGVSLQYMSDQTVLYTFNDWVNHDFDINRIGGGMASTFVPASALQRSIATSQDPTMRDAEAWYEWVMMGMPGLRPKLPEKKTKDDVSIENPDYGLVPGLLAPFRSRMGISGSSASSGGGVPLMPGGSPKMPSFGGQSAPKMPSFK